MQRKLKGEWGAFCDWIETLPHSELITEAYNKKIAKKKELKALKEENAKLKNQVGKLQQDCIRLSYAESLLAMAREMLDSCHAYDSDVYHEIGEFLFGVGEDE